MRVLVMIVIAALSAQAVATTVEVSPEPWQWKYDERENRPKARWYRFSNGKMVESQPTPLTLEGVNFEVDSSQLSEAAFPVLDGNIASLMAHPTVSVTIAGHADADGGESYNQVLSESRAQSVYDYFIAGGISADRLRTQGFGESLPIADNQSYSGKAKNRRIELHQGM